MAAEPNVSTNAPLDSTMRQSWWRRVFETPDELGFLPHAWLVFLGFFAVPIAFMPIGGPAFWICIVALAVFIPCYYGAFRRTGRAMRMPIAVIALLGTVLAPINLGSSVFFNYASFLVGQATSARRALLAVAAFCAIMLANAAIFGLPSHYYGPGILVSLGLVGISINERRRQLANSALRRSQEEVRRLARLAERERIARDLHDVVGHSLSVITLKADLAGKLVDSEPQRSAQELDDIARTSREALRAVRETIGGYHRVGLHRQVADAQQSLASAGIEVTTEIDEVDLPPRHESIVALILTEAVTNVIRHSGATACELALHTQANRVELIVHDNGHGFDGDEGHGLTGMRERLIVLGGELRFEDAPGTRLVAQLPAGKTR